MHHGSVSVMRELLPNEAGWCYRISYIIHFSLLFLIFLPVAMFGPRRSKLRHARRIW